MFTNFAQKLNGLFGINNFPPEAAELIISVLTQCNADLLHRGDVTFEGDVTFNGSTNIGGGSYAVANATWTRAGGHGSTVTALPASDPIGTLTGAAAITIVLPRSNAAMDPNVYSGDILQYVTIDGVNYAIGESYLDAPIGTVRWQHPTTVKHGWQLCDGTGSTPNLIGRFLYGATSSGGTGGSTTHTHTGSVTVNSGTASISSTNLSTTASAGTTGTTSLSTGSASGSSGSATTGITVDDHADHYHNQEAPCQALANATGPYCHNSPTSNITTGVVDSGGSPAVLGHSITDPGHTHTFGSHSHTISPDPHSHSIGSHTHAVSPDPHTHTDSGHTHTGSITIDAGGALPPYYELVPVIRISPTGAIS